jgi:hypothetical protein
MKEILSVAVLLLSFIAGPVFAGTLPAQLTWTNTDANDSIQIEKGPALTGNFAAINQVVPGTTGYTDATNAPGDTACYRVAYFNTSGIGPYAGPVCKTFPALPAQAPATFTVK